MCWPLGALWSSNTGGAPFKEWPQRRTNRAKLRNTARQFYDTQSKPLRSQRQKPFANVLGINRRFQNERKSVSDAYGSGRCLHHIRKCFCLPTTESAQKTCPTAFSYFQHASSKSKYYGVSGKITMTFISYTHTHPAVINLYLGLFVHIPGEGDGVVGDFFNVADRVEALLVISCGDTRGHGSFQV